LASSCHQQLEKQLKTVLVVAHDATNKALLCHILGLKPIISGTSGQWGSQRHDYPQGQNGLPVCCK